MDETYKMSMLLDFYGQLITKRQHEVLDLYYNSDYSLGEIAEELKISRQGVYDNIRRGKSALFEMENKLGLVRRFIKQKEKASEILMLLENVDISSLQAHDREILDRARKKVKSIMED